MKTKFFKSLLAIACLLISTNVSAQEDYFVVDSIIYIPNSASSCMIGGIAKKDFHIPETVVYNNKKYTVTMIMEKAFKQKSNLTSVTIPNTIKEIGRRAFDECTGLTNVVIPNSVVKLGSKVFDGCRNLTSVTIGKSVKEIGSDLFQNCTALSTLYSLNPTPPTIEGSDLGDNVSENLIIFVPRSALAKYKQAKVWKEFNLQAFDPK